VVVAVDLVAADLAVGAVAGLEAADLAVSAVGAPVGAGPAEAGSFDRAAAAEQNAEKL